jgi:plasmid stabilization system protein ParE
MRVVITGLARADLRRIDDWIARNNPRRAETFVRELVQRCSDLTIQSARYPIVTTVSGRPIRRCVHGAYLVFFEIERSSAIVRVLRILHGARNYAGLLGADDDGEGGND